MIRVSVVRGCWMEAVVKSVKSNVVILHTGTLCLYNKRQQKHTFRRLSRWSNKEIYRHTNKVIQWHSLHLHIHHSFSFFFFSKEPTGSAGQPLCRMFCTATVTNHSWGAGSSGVNESYPHMICHYIAANKAYYWLKQTQLRVSEEAEEIEEESICQDQIMSGPAYRYNNWVWWGVGRAGGHSVLVYKLSSH